MELETKLCTTCGEVKSIDLFAKPKREYCKPCNNKRIKAWRDAQRAIVLAARGPIIPRTEKPCKKCSTVYPIEHYYLQGGDRGSYCRKCCSAIASERRKNMRVDVLARERLRYKTKRMGTTPEWFDNTLTKQNGVCAICGNGETHPTKAGGETRSLAIDHNHKTGEVRGLLCCKCNQSLHLLERNRDWAQAAVRYLQEFD